MRFWFKSSKSKAKKARKSEKSHDASGPTVEPQSIQRIAEKRKTRSHHIESLQPAQQFRLLTIHAGQTRDSIRCSLKDYDFGADISYDALSYCPDQRPRHAPSNEPPQVVVELRMPRMDIYNFVSIEWNLGMALKHLRRTDKDVHIWVNGLCIERYFGKVMETREMAEQLARVKEIYTNARQVILWLGEDTENAKEVFQKAESMTQDLKQGASPVLGMTRREQRRISFANPIMGSERYALEKLMLRPCWNRSCTLPEVTLAQTLVLRCDDLTTSWDGFTLVCDAVDPISADFTDELVRPNADSEDLEALVRSHIRPIQLLKHQYERPRAFGHLRLLRLVHRFRDNECIDLVDRIYALLALANDKDREMNPPLPGLTPEQVCMRLVKTYADCYGRLDFLNYPKGDPDRIPQQWPSWLPYFNSAAIIPSLIEFPKDTGRWLRDDTQAFSASGDRPPRLTEFLNHPSRLGLLGLRVDTVHSRAILPPTEEDVHCNHLPDSTIKEISAFYQQYAPGAYRSKDLYDEAVRRTAISDTTVAPNTKANRRQSYAARRALRKEFTSTIPPLPTEDYGPFWDMAHAQPEATYRIHHRRKPFVTEKKYVGVGPSEVDPGDVIVVLCGGQTPYVIREKGKGIWTFVGEAYVHGFMDGETFLKVPTGSEERMMETFVLE